MISVPKYLNDLAGFVGDLRSLVFETHKKAAAYVNVNRATITRYENGAIRPPKGYLACLARLVVDQQKADIATTFQEALLQEVNQAVRHHYRDISFKDWNELCDVADEYLIEQRGKPQNDNKPQIKIPTGYVRLLVVVAIFLLVVVAVFYMVNLLTSCRLISLRSPILGPEIGDLKVEITSPKHCSLLPTSQHIPIEGTYSEDLAGREIWILVYASDRNYYPQSANACLMLPAEAARGRWATTLFDRTVEQLDIVVTVTNVGSEASQFFEGWLKSACDTGEFPGIPVSELPDGLTEMDAITVETKWSRRFSFSTH